MFKCAKCGSEDAVVVSARRGEATPHRTAPDAEVRRCLPLDAEVRRYARFIVIKNSRLLSVLPSRVRSSSTASTGFMSESTRRSM